MMEELSSVSNSTIFGRDVRCERFVAMVEMIRCGGGAVAVFIVVFVVVAVVVVGIGSTAGADLVVLFPPLGVLVAVELLVSPPFMVLFLLVAVAVANRSHSGLIFSAVAEAFIVLVVVAVVVDIGVVATALVFEAMIPVLVGLVPIVSLILQRERERLAPPPTCVFTLTGFSPKFQ